MSSESQAPKLKRQRTEDAPITRSERWLDDGNVVLQARNTQFRVHWSVLALHSQVFRVMRDGPQPSDELSVDGCPVVRLRDDPIDVEYLLNALYDPTFLGQKRLPLKCVGALIRLGRKYDFKGLLDSAVARLTAEFPTTLTKYDALQPKIETIKHYSGLEIDMITLLSENNIFSALPCACICLLELYTLGELFDGTLKSDGTRAFLSSTDLRRSVIGQQRLLLKQFEPGYTFGWICKWEFTGCTSSVLCHKVREDILARCLKNEQFLALVQPDWLKSDKLCAACARHASESILAGRKKIWQELPEIFDLPPWDELKATL